MKRRMSSNEAVAQLVRAVRSIPWGSVAPAIGLAGSIVWLGFDRSSAPVWSWIATAVLLVSLSTSWPMLQEADRAWRRSDSRLARVTRAAIPYVLVGVLACVVLWPLPAGVPPISQDHGPHYQSTRILVDRMLPHGRLFGWTDAVGEGVPFGDTYATAVYLLTALPHLLTFGAMPLEASYAIGVFAGWLLVAFAIVAWTRRLTRGWLGPFLAGAAFLLDPGGEREGGWLYSMFYAVWPHLVATGLLLWAILLLVRLSEKQTLGRLGAAVLVTGAATWAHPFNLPSLLVTGPLIILVFLLSRAGSGEDDPRRGSAWITVALALAAVVAAGWLSRFMGVAAANVHMGLLPWRTLAKQALAVLKEGLFDHQLMPIRALAVIGTIVMALRRRRMDVITVVVMMGILVVATMQPVLALDLGIHDQHRLVMYRRFSMTLKPFWYAAAGFGLAVLVEATSQWVEQHRPVVSRAHRGLVLVAVAPLLHSFVAATPYLASGPVARPLTAKRAGLTSELHALRSYLQAEAKRLGPGRPHLIVRDTQGAPAHYDLFATADVGFNYLPTNRPPALSYKQLNLGVNPDAWRWLGASVIVSPLPRHIAGAPLEARFGRFRVYRLDREPTYPVQLDSPGKVKVLEWTATERRFEVRGVEHATSLVIGMTPYYKWHAYQGGREIDLHPTFEKFRFRLTGVGPVHNGAVTLRYEDPPLQRALLLAAAVVMSLAFVALFFGRVPLPRLVCDQRLPRATKIAVAFLMAAAVGTAVAVVFMRESALAERWLGGEPPGTRVLEVLHQRVPDAFWFKPQHYCLEPFHRNPDLDCNPEDLRPVLRWAPPEGSRVPACLRFGVPPAGRSVLRYRLPRGTTAVRGWLHRWRGESAGLSGVVRVDGHPMGGLRPGQVLNVSVPPGARRFELDLRSGPRVSRACLEAVAVGRR